MKEARWSWGRQLYWGTILFLLFFFLSMFFYDETLNFRGFANLMLAFLSLYITFKSIGSFKILKVHISPTKALITFGVLAVTGTVIMALVENTPLHIFEAIQSKYIGLNIIMALSSAVLEESICRGLLLSGFVNLFVYESYPYTLTAGSICSALLFSIFHIVNLLGGNANAVFQQIVYAFSIGVFFAALRITTNGLFYPILLHFFLDLVPLEIFTENGSGNWILMLAIFMPILLFSIFYLLNMDKGLHII